MRLFEGGGESDPGHRLLVCFLQLGPSHKTSFWVVQTPNKSAKISVTKPVTVCASWCVRRPCSKLVKAIVKPSVSSKSEGMCDPPEKRDNDGGAVINKVTVMSYSYCLCFWLVGRRLRVAASMEINGRTVP